jgi:hypothetical protein
MSVNFFCELSFSRILGSVCADLGGRVGGVSGTFRTALVAISSYTSRVKATGDE